MTLFKKNNSQNFRIVFMGMYQTRKNTQKSLDKPQNTPYNVPISRMDVQTSQFQETSAETSSVIFQIIQKENRDIYGKQ